jgi:uncharacterized protein (TIGR04222 family)
MIANLSSSLPVTGITLSHWSEMPLTVCFAAFVAALVWSGIRVSRALLAFDSAHGDATVTNHYEIAYLAGGAPRMTQLAVVRLLHQGLLSLKNDRLIAETSSRPEIDPTGVEVGLLKAAAACSEKGLPVADLQKELQPRHRSVEVRLAAMGARPTDAERSRAGTSAVLPLIAFAGCLALVVLLRSFGDKPILLHFGLLIITILSVVAQASRLRRLTPYGQRLLDNLRTTHPYTRRQSSGTPEVQLEPASLLIGLYGMSVLEGLSEHS